MTRAAVNAPPGGRRARQKAARRAAIVAAARAVFAEKGYAAATTREIAERADVGTGTLFAYAADKELLLALVVGDDLRAVGEAAFAAVPPAAPLLDRLLVYFAPRYRFWGSDPAFARLAVKATFAAQYAQRDGDPDDAGAPPQTLVRAHLRALFAGDPHVARRAARDVALIADVVLDLYLSEHRDWVATAHPEVDAGLARLREVLAFALRGLDAAS